MEGVELRDPELWSSHV